MSEVCLFEEKSKCPISKDSILSEDTKQLLNIFKVIKVTWMCFAKKAALKISQNSQENTCTEVFFLMKLQAIGSELLHNYCPVNYWKFFRKRFLKNTSGRRSLKLISRTLMSVVALSNVLKSLKF